MKRRRIVVALLLLSTVLAANVVLFLFAQVRYGRRLAQQIWPPMVASPAVTNPPPNDPDVTMLLGDSRMAEWGLPSLRGRVVNASVPGATTAQLRLRLPAMLEQIRPGTVVIQAGINDLKFIGLKPDLGPAIVAQATDNLSNLVAQCVERRCRVVLLETWPTGKPEFLRRFVWNESVPDGVVRLNEKLRGLESPGNGVSVVDLFKAAGLAPDDSSFRDALHLKAEIYERLTPALERELKSSSPVVETAR